MRLRNGVGRRFEAASSPVSQPRQECMNQRAETFSRFTPVSQGAIPPQVVRNRCRLNRPRSGSSHQDRWIETCPDPRAMEKKADALESAAAFAATGAVSGGRTRSTRSTGLVDRFAITRDPPVGPARARYSALGAFESSSWSWSLANSRSTWPLRSSTLSAPLSLMPFRKNEGVPVTPASRPAAKSVSTKSL